jgi:hypothetical protein
MLCPGCDQTVGRLRFTESGEWLCYNCAPYTAKPIQNANPGHFPFVTRNMHPEGKAVEVKSLRHLRRLENKFGVQSGAWN